VNQPNRKKQVSEYKVDYVKYGEVCEKVHDFLDKNKVNRSGADIFDTVLNKLQKYLDAEDNIIEGESECLEG